MNVLVISTNRNQFPMPVIPLGACIVAEAAQKAGHDVRLLDLMFERNPATAIRQELNKFIPDIVGLSIRNIDNNDLRSPSFFIRELVPLIDIIRRATPVPIILGGAAVSVMPEELLRYTGASWAVTGDGETVFPVLLETLSRRESPNEIPGLAWMQDGVFTSNSLDPLKNTCNCRSPDYRRWIDVNNYLTHLTAIPLQTKIGCHFRCVYCTYRKIEGDNYRLADPGEVVDAIMKLASSGLRHIEFVDNVFNSPYDHALSICESLARVRHGAHLQSLELNPLFIDDPLVTAMERAGFSGIGITVESASDRVLEGLGKGFSTRHIYKTAEIISRHSLPCVWIFLVGGPNETRETVIETLQFAEQHIRPQDIAFFGIGIRIYPGTGLETIARNQGVLSLSPQEMLEPVFYLSPTVEYGWMQKQIKNFTKKHLNFIDSDSLGVPVLPAIHAIGYRLGLRPPLWRYTRPIRRCLRLVGMDA